MFVCAHPAIDPAARTPLMLQAVLGLDAARIASAFLVSPGTMSQRLVRAKGKIRDAGIAFSIPGRDDLPERLDAVLAAIYAAYGSGWDDAAGADPKRRGLAREAIDLARVLAALLPAEPEPAGLLALMLYCDARQAARRDRDGRFVPLSEQDLSLWNARDDRRGRTIPVTRRSHGPARAVPDGGGDPVRACKARHHGRDEFRGAGHALRRVGGHDPYAGRTRGPGGRFGRPFRARLPGWPRSTNCRRPPLRSTSPPGRCGRICWRDWATRQAPGRLIPAPRCWRTTSPCGSSCVREWSGSMDSGTSGARPIASDACFW